MHTCTCEFTVKECCVCLFNENLTWVKNIKTYAVNNVNIPLFHLIMTEFSLLYEIYLSQNTCTDLLRDLLQIGLLLTKYSTSSSFILEIQSNAWLCHINLCRRRQWWWKQNKEQGNNEHVFTVISRYSQHRCHTGAKKIPKHSEHLIWLFYNDLHFKHPHLCHVSPTICLFTHLPTQLKNE